MSKRILAVSMAAVMLVTTLAVGGWSVLAETTTGPDSYSFNNTTFPTGATGEGTTIGVTTGKDGNAAFGAVVDDGVTKVVHTKTVSTEKYLSSYWDSTTKLPKETVDWVVHKYIRRKL